MEERQDEDVDNYPLRGSKISLITAPLAVTPMGAMWVAIYVATNGSRPSSSRRTSRSRRVAPTKAKQDCRAAGDRQESGTERGHRTAQTQGKTSTWWKHCSMFVSAGAERSKCT